MTLRDLVAVKKNRFHVWYCPACGRGQQGGGIGETRVCRYCKAEVLVEPKP